MVRRSSRRLEQVAEGSKLKLLQESREGGENSKAPAGVGSPPSIAMRGELHGPGRRGSGASRFHVDSSETPPSPPPQAPVEGPRRSSAEGRTNDSHDPDGLSKNLDPVRPAPTGSHSSHEDEHGSRSPSQMPRAKDRSGRSASIHWIGLPSTIPWIGLPCSRCKSTNFIMYTDVNEDPEFNLMHYKCKNCQQSLCREMVISHKVGDRARKGASQHKRTRNGLHSKIVQAMNHLKRSKLAASNSNTQAMPPPSDSNMKAKRPTSDLDRILMPPPSYTRKPNVCLVNSQDNNACRSDQTTLPPSSSSCGDQLEDDHPSRESNLQLVVAPEPEERFPRTILKGKEPVHSSANLRELPSFQSSKGILKEPSLANDGFSLRDSIRGHQSSPPEENKNGNGGGAVSDGGSPSNGLPCPRCTSTKTRIYLPGCHFCDKCYRYFTLDHLQQHEVQLPSKQFPKGKEKEVETPNEDADQLLGKDLVDSSRGPRSLPWHGSEDGDGGSREVQLPSKQFQKGKEKEVETPNEDADQLLGKDLVDSSRDPRSLPWHGSEDGDGGSREGPWSALSCCSGCKSTLTRLCTYGLFCEACGKYSPFEKTRDREVPASLPVAMVHEVFDADGRGRGYKLQSLAPPRRPITVDASTQTDPGAMVSTDIASGKHETGHEVFPSQGYEGSEPGNSAGDGEFSSDTKDEKSAEDPYFGMFDEPDSSNQWNENQVFDDAPDSGDSWGLNDWFGGDGDN